MILPIEFRHSGREIHRILNVGSKYSDWMARRIKIGGLVRGVHYELISETCPRTRRTHMLNKLGVSIIFDIDVYNPNSFQVVKMIMVEHPTDLCKMASDLMSMANVLGIPLEKAQRKVVEIIKNTNGVNYSALLGD